MNVLNIRKPKAENILNTRNKYVNFSLFSMAFCVSLGAALVSLTKLLILIAFVVKVFADGPKRIANRIKTGHSSLIIPIAVIVWFLLSVIWTEASLADALKVLYGHTRLLWLLMIFYLLDTSERALNTLSWLALGQVLVVVLSWLLWLGVPLGFISSKYSPEMGIVFTSTLEQPVMTTLLAVLLWHLRDHWVNRFNRWLIFAIIILAVSNVCFVMIGRTGYLAMLIFIGLSILMVLPLRLRLRFAGLVIPFLIAALLFQQVPRVSQRMTQVWDEIQQFEKGNPDTSTGLRLEKWRISLSAIREAPVLGHGVGSFAVVYKNNGGFENRVIRDPHQQYLFWWVEGGLVAFSLLIAFFLSLYKSAFLLRSGPQRALICTVAIMATMSLFNCPLFGVGMSEFFFVIIACLLATNNKIMRPQQYLNNV
jgi:O-antigen ligase